jgi:hypothetical protein
MHQEGETVYDDDNDYGKKRGDSEMPTMRAPMGETDARSSQGLSELQTDEMGQTGLGRPGRGYQAFGFVYIVETIDERIKMGFTRFLVRRMWSIRYEVVHCPIRLIAFFPAGTATEAWLHTKFGEHRIVGDLYRRDKAILDFAEQIGFPRRYRTTWNVTEAKLKCFMEFR